MNRLLVLTPVQTGNMMSRGSAGRGQRVSSRRLRLMDLSIKWELILPTVSLSPDFAGVQREFQHQAAQGQTAWLLKLLSVMVRKSGSALLIDQSKGNKAAKPSDAKQKANRIGFISCQIHRHLRPILSTSVQLIMKISNSYCESFAALISAMKINFLSFTLLYYRFVKDWKRETRYSD